MSRLFCWVSCGKVRAGKVGVCLGAALFVLWPNPTLKRTTLWRLLFLVTRASAAP